MADIIVECGHCGGEGVCKRGDEYYSCSICQHAAGYTATVRRHVKCSVCKGKGKILLEK